MRDDLDGDLDDEEIARAWREFLGLPDEVEGQSWS